MRNYLSYSQVATFSECGEKYRLRYLEGKRSKEVRAALLFGKAIDSGLNSLLTKKDLDASIEAFLLDWNHQAVADNPLAFLPTNPNILYPDSAIDFDLIEAADQGFIMHFASSNSLTEESKGTLKEQVEILQAKKKETELEVNEKSFLNFLSWFCYEKKGRVLLTSYYSEILPQIKEVLAVQQVNHLYLDSSFLVLQYPDMIVRWSDDRIILFDNKTSYRLLEDDAPSDHPQLLSYYAGCKEQYKINAIGLIVLSQSLKKTKLKICQTCGADGSGGRHQSCANEYLGVRCRGAFNTSLSLSGNIQTLICDPTPESEELVIETFKDTYEQISKGVFFKEPITVQAPVYDL